MSRKRGIEEQLPQDGVQMTRAAKEKGSQAAAAAAAKLERYAHVPSLSPAKGGNQQVTT